MIPRSHGKPGTMFLLGARVDNTDCETALNVVRMSILYSNHSVPTKVFFTNVHTIHLARRDKEFMRVVNTADVVLPDGSGVALAGKLLQQPIIENLNGTDFIPKVLREAAANGWSVYLFGGKPGIAEQCRHFFRVKLPSLRIVGMHHGHYSIGEEQLIVDDINTKRPDILLVALGSPLQEQWIERHTPHLQVRVCFGVGGLFDFISGRYKRAPKWVRSLGLEWVVRFAHDPMTKWERVLVEIPLFLLLVLAKRFVPRNVRRFIKQTKVVL
ncbi:MAG: WecB/TagA/CpsF family glycosyltransferase [Ignavibacteriales bacterium]|nr:WecB/TagA/CpsF family glycosyltransferase [Ignavibacteriales bacterium]